MKSTIPRFTVVKREREADDYESLLKYGDLGACFVDGTQESRPKSKPAL